MSVEKRVRRGGKFDRGGGRGKGRHATGDDGIPRES